LDTDLWIDHPANREAVRTVLPVFLCPSAGEPRRVGRNVLLNVTRTMTTPAATLPQTGADAFRNGRSHYAGVQCENLLSVSGERATPKLREDPPRGMLIAHPPSQNDPIPRALNDPIYRTLGDAWDGTSNTLILTEDTDHRDSAWASLRNLFVQMNSMPRYADSRSCIGTMDDFGNWGTAGINEPCARGLEEWNNTFSYHPGGVMILMLDGSAHFISERIHYLTYAHLINRASGQTVQLP